LKKFLAAAAILFSMLAAQAQLVRPGVHAVSQSLIFRINDSAQIRNAASVILPPNYYVNNLGVMCKQERIVEKRTGIRLRLRAGSLEQCNLLEGKQRF